MPTKKVIKTMGSTTHSRMLESSSSSGSLIVPVPPLGPAPAATGPPATGPGAASASGTSPSATGGMDVIACRWREARAGLFRESAAVARPSEAQRSAGGGLSHRSCCYGLRVAEPRRALPRPRPGIAPLCGRHRNCQAFGHRHSKE